MQLSGEGRGYVLQCPVRSHGEDPRFGLRVPSPRLQGKYRYLNCQKILRRQRLVLFRIMFSKRDAALVCKNSLRNRNLWFVAEACFIRGFCDAGDYGFADSFVSFGVGDKDSDGQAATVGDRDQADVVGSVRYAVGGV